MTALELVEQHLDAAVRDLRRLRRERPATVAEQVHLERRLRVAVRGVVELEARLADLLGLERLPDLDELQEAAA